MRMARRAITAGLVLVLIALSTMGCLMPANGTPVYVDSRAGNFWSGEGSLTTVSNDERRCEVAVRDRALIVQSFWVDCRWVHPRNAR